MLRLLPIILFELVFWSACLGCLLGLFLGDLCLAAFSLFVILFLIFSIFYGLHCVSETLPLRNSHYVRGSRRVFIWCIPLALTGYRVYEVSCREWPVWRRSPYVISRVSPSGRVSVVRLFPGIYLV